MRNTPLWDAVRLYAGRGLYPFHVPGHKAGRGLPAAYIESLVRYDVTEVSGLDNLYDPQGPIAEAEMLAAQLFGVKATLFTTNGSSSGLTAAVLACCSSGDRLVLPRNAHISLLHACILGDLEPVFVDVEIDARLGVVLGMRPQEFNQALAQNAPRAAVVVHPNYHGVCSDLKELAAACTKEGTKLIVDEAHGTHLYLSENPTSSVFEPASIVVQSVHKTGLALTGAAWIHVLEEGLVTRVKDSLRLVQSTSPSYLLLSSLDIARGAMEFEGEQLFTQAQEAAKAIEVMVPLYKPPRPYVCDPLRLVVDALKLGLTGFALAEAWSNYGISVEMAEQNTVTLVLSLADGSESVECMAKACQKLQTTNPAEYSHFFLPPMPKQVLRPRDVYYLPKVYVGLDAAKGRIVGNAITPYPPGVPLVWPGQVLTTDIIEYIKLCLSQGVGLAGLATGTKVLVAAEG